MTSHFFPITLTAASWLLTYAVHSTLLLGLAWLLGRLLGTRRLALQELIWRAAVVGGLLTASLQVGLGVGGALDLSALLQSAAPTEVASPSSQIAAVVPAVLDAGEYPMESSMTSGAMAPWPAFFVLLWLAGSAVCVIRVLRASRDLRRLLSDRLPVSRGPLARALKRLLRLIPERPPVALSSSQSVPIPVALGIRRPEICVPERAMAELPPAQQEGLCAHELAHLVRRDPMWSMLLAVINGIFFFQPLNRVARHHLREIAEFRCDDWAALSTGRGHDLARCLAHVAEWSCDRTFSPLPTPALLGSSRLARRVRRLVSGAGEFDRIARPHGAIMATGALLLGFGMVLPGVGLARSSWAMGGQEPSMMGSSTDPVPTAAPAPEPEEPEVRILQEKELNEKLDPKTKKEMESLEAEIESLSEEIEKRAQSIQESYRPYEEQSREFEEQQKKYEEMALKMEKELGAIEIPEVDTTALEAEIQKLSEELEKSHLEHADSAQTAEIRKELKSRVQEVLSKKKLSKESIQKIQDRAKEIAEAMKPAKEQMRQFAEKMRAMAEEMRPEREEIRQLREQIRERAERLREIAQAASKAEKPAAPPKAPKPPAPPAEVEEPPMPKTVADTTP